MNYKRIIVLIILFLFIGIQMSSVIASVKDFNIDNTFFYTNKLEISPDETLEMTLDISKIKHNEFEFNLSSNLDINNIVTKDNVKLDAYNNNITISIDKSKINLDKITFYYQIPKTTEIGTKIELIAQIKYEQENKNADNTTINTTKTENKITENTTTTTETKNDVVEKIKVEVNIVENKQNNKQAEQQDLNKSNNNSEKPDLSKSDNDIEKQNFNKSNNETEKKIEDTNINNTVKSISSSTQSVTETAVYKGSSNNYLSNLEIEGEELNTVFNKENLTYFVKTNGKTELNVITTAEDDDAKIYISGNENLKTGDNKILILVTANNGDVRYYRVFVTNN